MNTTMVGSSFELITPWGIYPKPTSIVSNAISPTMNNEKTEPKNKMELIEEILKF